MSGCHDPIKTCKHGMSAMLCELCSIDKKFDSICVRLDEYESRIMKKYIEIENSHNNLSIQVFTRLEKLESEIKPDIFAQMKQYTDIINRLDIFNNRLNGLDCFRTRIIAEECLWFHKTPHKCPVCSVKPFEDLKIVRTDSGRDKIVIECLGCEGTGIVWG
jgi:hypothetical protein